MKFLCIGRNYVEHAKELGNEVPEEPVIFMKPKSALLQANSPFYYPEFTNELHYECEIVLRISKNGKYIPEKSAKSYYDAISVGIDFTARDIQSELKKKGLPWEKAKAFDDSAVLGKWIPLTAAILDQPIHFSLHKNATVVQDGDSSLMIFSLATILESITEYFTIYPGDLIYTGTPVGVGPTLKGDVFEGYFEANQVFSVKVNP
jgi:2-keto-4-pentenoate hydratase/2-oxohepta-3-ene-1,7-dioic acid hydratase in catechol pathway